MKQLKLIILTLSLSLIGLGATNVIAYALPSASAVYVADANTADACAGLDEISASQDCSTDGKGVTDVAGDIVNILSIIVGIAAVIMIIVAGLKYVTSNGDANSISSAKTTLIYALVGVFIAAIAQVLVHFVLSATNKA